MGLHGPSISGLAGLGVSKLCPLKMSGLYSSQHPLAQATFGKKKLPDAWAGSQGSLLSFLDSSYSIFTQIYPICNLCRSSLPGFKHCVRILEELKLDQM